MIQIFASTIIILVNLLFDAVYDHFKARNVDYKYHDATVPFLLSLAARIGGSYILISFALRKTSAIIRFIVLGTVFVLVLASVFRILIYKAEKLHKIKNVLWNISERHFTAVFAVIGIMIVTSCVFLYHYSTAFYIDIDGTVHTGKDGIIDYGLDKEEPHGDYSPIGDSNSDDVFSWYDFNYLGVTLEKLRHEDREYNEEASPIRISTITPVVYPSKEAVITVKCNSEREHHIFVLYGDAELKITENDIKPNAPGYVSFSWNMGSSEYAGKYDVIITDGVDYVKTAIKLEANERTPSKIEEYFSNIPFQAVMITIALLLFIISRTLDLLDMADRLCTVLNVISFICAICGLFFFILFIIFWLITYLPDKHASDKKINDLTKGLEAANIEIELLKKTY